MKLLLFFVGASLAAAMSPDVAVLTPDGGDCVCGALCRTASGFTGTCGADGATCANWLVEPDCSAATATTGPPAAGGSATTGDLPSYDGYRGYYASYYYSYGWQYSSPELVLTDWCPDSPQLTCRMMDVPVYCPAGNCGMRLNSCTSEFDCLPEKTCDEIWCAGSTCATWNAKGVDPTKLGSDGTGADSSSDTSAGACQACATCNSPCSWWSCDADIK